MQKRYVARRGTLGLARPRDEFIAISVTEQAASSVRGFGSKRHVARRDALGLARPRDEFIAITVTEQAANNVRGFGSKRHVAREGTLGLASPRDEFIAISVTECAAIQQPEWLPGVVVGFAATQCTSQSGCQGWRWVSQLRNLPVRVAARGGGGALRIFGAIYQSEWLPGVVVGLQKLQNCRWQFRLGFIM